LPLFGEPPLDTLTVPYVPPAETPGVATVLVYLPAVNDGVAGTSI
jgi:hypothetical protein